MAGKTSKQSFLAATSGIAGLGRTALIVIRAATAALADLIKRLFHLPDACRIIMVAAENRTVAILAESRMVRLVTESRGVAVMAENRMIALGIENRTVRIIGC